jgi:serine/threonine protein kinase
MSSTERHDGKSNTDVEHGPKLSHIQQGERLSLLSALNCVVNPDYPNVLDRGERIADTSFRRGDPISDQWIVMDLLDKGSWGVVYLTYDRKSRELVAVKTIREDIELSDHIRKLFHKEALAWMNIEPHQNVLRARDVRNLGGNIYISMDYIPAQEGIEGSSLRHWLETYKRFEDETILQWAVQFCDGMEHAYQCGIKCHRDIKPENILIDSEENIRIVDFGLAILKHDETAFKGGCGDPHYMCPEQFLGSKKADARNDIYSFGIVLFEMIKGRRPFVVDFNQYQKYSDLKTALWNILERVHREEPVPEIRKPFGGIIHKCLEKDPEHRYVSFEEIKNELLKLCRGTKSLAKKPPKPTASQTGPNVKGLQFLELFLFKEAEVQFDQTLSSEPRDLTALNGKGICLTEQFRFEQALQCFELALSVDQKSIAALIGKGICLQKLERYDQAENVFKEALDVPPQLPMIWYCLGKNHFISGSMKKAIKCFNHALDLLIGQKRKEEASTIINEALKFFPRDMRLRQQRGMIIRMRDKVEKDLKETIKVLESLPAEFKTNAETAGILAGAYKRLWDINKKKYYDNLKKAYEIYNNSWEHSGRKNTYTGINAATLSLLLGRPQASREIAKEIINIYDTEHPQAFAGPGIRSSSYWDRATLAEAKLLIGRIGEARRLYQDIMDLYSQKKAYTDSSMDQLKLILPCLGITMGVNEFLNLPADLIKPWRISVGVIGDLEIESSAVMKDILEKTFGELKQELPDNLSYEVLSPLSTSAERFVAKLLLSKYKLNIRVLMPFEVVDHITIMGGETAADDEEYLNFLKRVEELIFFRTDNNPETEYFENGRYLVDHCDLLLGLWDEEEENNDVIRGIKVYAKKKGIPLIELNQLTPKELNQENVQKLRSADFLKGGYPMCQAKPINTTNVQLSDDLIELTEILAENAHENWAEMRLAEGWSFGPEPNNNEKKHPDLVPYKDLPASEKEIDRKMAMETLKAVLTLGYRIEKI